MKIISGRPLKEFWKSWSEKAKPDQPLDEENAAPRTFAHVPSSSLSSLPTPATSDDTPVDNDTSHEESRSPEPEKQATSVPLASPTPQAVANVSFETFATQSSNARSSQRIVKDGETFIIDSDDDSDISLADLNDLLRERDGQPSSRRQQSPEPQLESETGRKRKLPTPPVIVPKKKKPAFSLSELAARSKAYEASRMDIAAAESLIKEEETQEKEAKVFGMDDIQPLIQERNEDASVDRIKGAIARTDLLYQEQRWDFFAESEEPSSNLLPLFPKLDDAELKPLLSRPAMREQTFTSGFMEDMAMKSMLPEELVGWILDAAYLEPSEDLSQSYLHIIKAGANDFATVITEDRINTCFSNVGACPSALNLSTPIEPGHRTERKSNQTQAPHAPPLFKLCQLLDALTPHLSPPIILHILSLTSRLLLDTSLTSSPNLSITIDNLLCNLVDTLSNLGGTCVPSVLLILQKSTSSPSLRAHLLRNLPTSTQIWLHIRRQLALTWFLSLSPDDLHHTIPFSLPQILSTLSSPEYKISHFTNYALLTPSITILDFALDTCHPSPTFSSSSPSSQPSSQTLLASRPPHNQPRAKTEERETPFDLLDPQTSKLFNQQIDALASKLQSLFRSIVDSGASDIRRTEAKEALECLRARLLYSVRTKRPPRRGILGAEMGWGEDLEGEKKGMEGWLGKS